MEKQVAWNGLEELTYKNIINPLMPGGNKKATNI